MGVSGGPGDGTSPASRAAVAGMPGAAAVPAVRVPGARGAGARAGRGGAPTDAPGAPRTAPSPSSVRLDIGELVLTGFDRTVDTARVTAAFEAELARLVREHGVPLAAEGGRALDAVGDLPPLPPGLSARRLGQELARAVHAGLSGRGEVR
jgi:hypothetical protein